MASRPIIIITARDEADRLPATLAALAGAFPGARVVVADDGSRDATGHEALQAGAELGRAGPARGKGGAAAPGAERGGGGAGGARPPPGGPCGGGPRGGAAAPGAP